MNKKTGAQLLVDCLIEEGVETLFGYPGGAVLPVYDVLYDAPLKHILVRHEQGAVHAADGYARSTGKPGVALLTSGPGATNGVTGIATAYTDSIPLVVFTGQVPTSLIGNDAFQEADIVGMTRPCTKHSYLVKDVNELARTIKEAFWIASTGKPGPVLVDLPKDVLVGSTDKTEYPEKVDIRGYKPTSKGHGKQEKRFLEALFRAKRPLFLAGGGTILSGCFDELQSFYDKTKVPVSFTLMGLSGFSAGNEFALGMCGMHGSYASNMAIQESDLLISLGARFDDRVTGTVHTFAPKAKIVHIDIDPSSIGKNVHVDIPLVGDLKQIMSNLNKALLEKYSDQQLEIAEWHAQVKKWMTENPLVFERSSDEIKPQFVVEEACRVTEGKAIVTTEVGQAQMWAAQFYRFQATRSFLTSGGLGTMGYGFPAAMGAKIAHPERTVINIAGDGSIQMNIQEMATCVQYDIPVVNIILNNGYLGMVRQWQELFFEHRYSNSDMMPAQPDFVKLAEAYGGVGFRSDKPEEVEGILKEAISCKRPVLIDFRVSREENVYPMVPAGKAINEMLLC